MKIACLIFFPFLITPFVAVAQPSAERKKIAAEMKHSMKALLLDVWYPKDVDSVYGGFLSDFTYDFKPGTVQDKMIVTQARHVWSNARAAELYPQNRGYKKSAQQGFYFLRDFFWDKQNGGFYTLLSRDGKVKPSSLGDKIAYGNSFGIYALAAYYRCSGDTAALNLAKKTFYWLEKHSHDPVHKGYYQHMQMDGTPVERTAAIASTAETGYKDQNSSIHLLEAFTELYYVWPDPLLAERLKEMLLLIRDTITTSKGNLTLFFEPDWTPVSFRNTTYDNIIQHRNLDHVSFGHDVETAYLMLEASHALGIKDESQTMEISKKMIDHALRNGWDNKVGGFYDEGYYFKDSASITIIRDSKNWWAQAEGLNTLLMMSDYFPADKMQYYKKFLQQWQYVQAYLVDHEHGDWYSGGLDKEPEQKTASKGNIWKGTYHVLRAFVNCIERLEPDKISPSVPQALALKIKSGLLLKWNESTDNRQLLGYNIYCNGVKIAFTPLLLYNIPGGSAKKGDFYTIHAADVSGNESAASNKLVF
ncbi:MAG: AGE family epimerase/isomerase [Bacteroidota bacterium]